MDAYAAGCLVFEEEEYNTKNTPVIKKSNSFDVGKNKSCHGKPESSGQRMDQR